MKTIPDARPLVVGLGCSSSATSGELIALISSTLALTRLDPIHIAAFATHIRRRDNLALVEAAGHFDVPLRFLDDDEMASGIFSTCEAAAAAAGTLILHKRKSAYATCAIASVAPGFSVAAFGQPAAPSAAMASSMPATSVAGP